MTVLSQAGKTVTGLGECQWLYCDRLVVQGYKPWWGLMTNDYCHRLMIEGHWPWWMLVVRLRLYCHRLVIQDYRPWWVLVTSGCTITAGDTVLPILVSVSNCLLCCCRLVIQGYKRALVKEDLWTLNKEDTSAAVKELYDEHWQAQVRKIQK